MKAVFVGDAAAGKSCLLQRIVDDRYRRPRATIALYDVNKRVTIGAKTLNFNIWDTPGNELARDEAAKPIRHVASVVIVAFDTTDEESLGKLVVASSVANAERILIGRNMPECSVTGFYVEVASWWLDELRDLNKAYRADTPIRRELTVLVACKVDLDKQRKVRKSHAMMVAKNAGVAYIETSARTGQNCQRLLLHLHQQIVNLTEPRFAHGSILRPEKREVHWMPEGAALDLQPTSHTPEGSWCSCCAIM